MNDEVKRLAFELLKEMKDVVWLDEDKQVDAISKSIELAGLFLNVWDGIEDQGD